MTFPISLGWPQFFLLLIALLGIVLLATAFRRRRRIETFTDEQGVIRERRRHRGIGWGRAMSGIVLVAVALSLLWAVVALQTYLGLTHEIKVAHIRATQVTNVPHEMFVELTQYDGNNHATSTGTFQVQGDEWMVQGNIIKLASWLNIVGLHSGYKLTRLEGRYDDIKLEDTAPHTAVALNGGDDNFFQTMRAQRGWIAPFVDASYGNAVFQTAGSFDIFATQDALIARPT